MSHLGSKQLELPGWKDPGSRFRLVLAYIGPVIGIIGISLAIYFHSQSVQERIPVYYINPQRVTLVDTSGPTPSELEVLHRGRKITAANVVAVTLYFWNDGRMPISSGDILEPITLSLPQGGEILEARVLRVSRPVCKFQVAQPQRNTLIVSFDILEKSDGAAVQVVYAGPSDASISASGAVVGAGRPKLFSAKSNERLFKVQSPNETLRDERHASYFIFGLTTLVLIGFLVLWKWKGLGFDLAGVMVVVVPAVVFFALASYLMYDTYKAASPGIPDTIWAK